MFQSGKVESLIDNLFRVKLRHFLRLNAISSLTGIYFAILRRETMVFVKNRREAVFPKVDTPYGQAPLGLEGSGAFGAVGIGAGTWTVLSSIPEG